MAHGAVEMVLQEIMFSDFATCEAGRRILYLAAMMNRLLRTLAGSCSAPAIGQSYNGPESAGIRLRQPPLADWKLRAVTPDPEPRQPGQPGASWSAPPPIGQCGIEDRRRYGVLVAQRRRYQGYLLSDGTPVLQPECRRKFLNGLTHDNAGNLLQRISRRKASSAFTSHRGLSAPELPLRCRIRLTESS